MNNQNILVIPAPIMVPIPPDMPLQVTLWIIITGTFAQTNFFGGVAPFHNPKLVAGDLVYFARDRNVRPWDYQNGLYYQ